MSDKKFGLGILATFTGMLMTFAIPGSAHSAESSVADKYKITLMTSYNYSIGDYGQAKDTKITYVPVTAKVKRDYWTAKLTVPYIRIEGPGVVVGGEDTAVTGAAQPVGTEDGLGDILTSLSYAHPLGTQGTFGDITGKIKFPTADEDRNLGTGEFDYTLQLGVTQMIGDAFLTGSAGRKFNGSSARFNLDDVWKTSAGAGYKFTPELTVGVNYDWREASTRTGANYSHAIGFATYKITDNWETQAYAGTGFTDASPNFSTGLQISYKFDSFGSPSED